MKKNNLYNQIDRICKKRSDPFNVRKSTAFVVKHVKHVSLIQENTRLLAKELENRIQERKLLTHTQFGKIDVSPQMVFLQKGSRDEVEIRSTTVWAGELLSELMGISPALVDNALLLLGSELSTTLKPYHRTHATYY